MLDECNAHFNYLNKLVWGLIEQIKQNKKLYL